MMRRYLLVLDMDLLAVDERSAWSRSAISSPGTKNSRPR
jgi:hypothetical protein